MSYSPYYTGGWQTGETGGTPITPAALNHMDSGIGANAAAAAEQAEDISDVNALLGNTSMGTTATTVTGAIKEHSNKIGNTSMGTTAQTLTGAIAEHESDITALNGNLEVKALTFTLQNQPSATNSLLVRQSGQTVTVFGAVTGLTLTANTETTIGTISGGLLPASPVRGLCSVGSNAYTVGTLSYVAIGATGNVVITTSNGGSGKAVYFNLTYIR